MHGVEAENVDVKVANPIQGILDKEPAHLIAPFAVEVDGLAPGSAIAVGKVRSKIGEVIAFGTQMVVDDIERDTEIFVVTSVDESLSILTVRHRNFAPQKGKRRHSPSSFVLEIVRPA